MAKRIGPIAAGATVVALVLAGLYVVVRGYPGEIASRAAEAHSSSPPVAVHDLDSVSQLRATFNDNLGTPRLILLLSPT